MQVPFYDFKTHLTYPAPSAAAEIENARRSVVVVYLRPSTVSITVTKVLLDVLDVLVVLDVVAGAGAGAGAPLIGISPARTVTDISPVRAIAKPKRFMLKSPFDLMMQLYLYQK